MQAQTRANLPQAQNVIKSDIEQIVVQSLISSFGLDFLLFQDKDGGSADTVHNVRKGIYATEDELNPYNQRGEYDPHKYHSDKTYIEANKKGKELKEKGRLVDAYTGKKIAQNEKIDLDHIISAKEIHNDAGRILAGLDGVNLANDKTNLVHTNRSLNRSKKDKNMHEFVEILKDSTELHEIQTIYCQTILDSPSVTTQSERDVARKNLEKIKNLQSANHEKMLAADKKARDEYNQKINSKYYLGDETNTLRKALTDKKSFDAFINSKFAKQVKMDMTTRATKMAIRQATGVALAYAWIEIKECAISVYGDFKQGEFELKKFFIKVANSLKAIFDRVINNLGNIIKALQDGALAGALSSITTALINIVFTTAKNVIKIIREIYAYIIQALKLLVLNTNKLGKTELTNEFLLIIAAGVSTVLGAQIAGYLQGFLSAIPINEIRDGVYDFILSVSFGLINYALICFLNKSDFANKFWVFVDKFTDDTVLKQLKEANKKLDEYLLGLAKIEFGFSANELDLISNTISQIDISSNWQQQLAVINKNTNITLSFNLNDNESIKAWILSDE